MNPRSIVEEVVIPTGTVDIGGDLRVPERACGLVLFVHGPGSSRFSVRNRQIAGYLEDRGYATLLIDLLTREEDVQDLRTAEYRFDIPRLARRIEAAIDWVAVHPLTASLPIGCFATSTGAAATLMAAAERPATVLAIVSRAGRPDLAGTDALTRVEAPTLLIVGSHDETLIEMNEWARRQMQTQVTLEIIARATHLFDEPGALDRVAWLASRWFGRYLAGVAISVPVLA